ncbi:MAG TPA: thiol reductant ABC exporter subunit CydC, partial [Gammaproteobacteria bacterium]|nr:thiol reductant ABC exporter subunit CydC [Gammaproteobacteria bacterium]
MIRLVRLGRSARAAFALGALLALVVILANVALLGLAGWFIAAMAAAGLAGASINYFTPAAGIRAFAILRTVGRYLERLVNHDATLKLLSQLRVWLYARIEPLAPAVLARYRKGDVLTRLVADVNTLDNAWLRVFSPALVAFLATVALFVFLLFFSPRVAGVDLALLVVIGAILPFLAQRLGRRPAARAAQTAGRLKAELAEDFAGLAELAVLGAGSAHCKRNDERSRKLAREQDRGFAIEALALGAAVAASGAALALTWLLLAPGSADGRTNALLLPLLMFFVLASTEAVQGLPNAFRALGDTLAAARRVFEIGDETPVVVESPRALERVAGLALAFDRLRFRYAGQTGWALDDVTFSLPEGAAVAVVGPSGAGKSSLAQLLLRFYDPEAGTIRLGGLPLASYALETLRGQFAYAAQSTRLFSTTIRENLRLGSPQADDETLWNALEAVCLSREVRGFARGLDHFVGAGGMALSAGQARRLALARAWLSPAPILLLDEPTEDLDAASERTIMKCLTDDRGKRGLLLIT